MPIKSFRGLIADNSIDTINLHTKDGSIGYRITKFQIMPQDPGNNDTENVVKIFKIPQTATSATIDFSDQTLLAAGYYLSGSATTRMQDTTVVFDNEIFNQDIYVTNVETTASGAINYYIELEQIKLDLNENTVATLKDIRNIEAQ
tara:strand:+ start:107 stop:544 length:438 start_codon:yes stop_codon:yes gene_type:complete